MLFVALCVLGWYLGIKTHDYEIRLTVPASKVSVYYRINALERWDMNSRKDEIQVLNSKPYQSVSQDIVISDSLKFQIDWTLHRIHDSITQIHVGIIAKPNSLSHRLQILSASSMILPTIKAGLKQFRKEIKKDAATFKVIINGIKASPSFDYMCTNIKSSRKQKASSMIKQNVDVYPALATYGLKKKGYPFLKVKNWDMETDQMTFRFGFPIYPKDTLINDPKIHLGSEASVKAIKATFYGNYRRSDEAWFALQTHAEAQGLKIKREPLELFYNNPMQGGNELTWKAEVFMPIN